MLTCNKFSFRSDLGASFYPKVLPGSEALPSDRNEILYSDGYIICYTSCELHALILEFLNGMVAQCTSANALAARIKLNRETKNFPRYAYNLRLMETSLNGYLGHFFE